MMSKEKWDKFWKKSEFPILTRLGFSMEKNAIKRIFDKIGMEKDAKIVDFGCGECRTLSYIRKFGFKNSIGIDNSEEAIKLCCKKGFKINQDIFFSNNGVKADLLFSQGLLEHYLKRDWKPIIKDMVDTGAKTIILMQPLTRSLTFKAIESLNRFTLQENEYDYKVFDYVYAFHKFGFELKFTETTHKLPEFLDMSIFIVFEKREEDE